MSDVITLRGERELWLEFIHKAKKEKKKVWEILSPFLKKYLSADQEYRILLILFPKDLLDRLMERDDPDKFIEQALRKVVGKP